MRTFDIARLVASSPVPLILTCRPERERGGFTGPESERMAILRSAHDHGCAYIDVEADRLDLVAGWGGGSPTRSSRPSTGSTGCRPTCSARTATCATAAPWSSWWAPRGRLPTCFRCWNCCGTRARRSSAWPWAPPGTCTRILAPAFPHTLLTYGAATPAAVTAPARSPWTR
jgi:3-dehydroquinate dehydratase